MSSEQLFACVTCPLRYPTTAALRGHVGDVHYDYTPFLCRTGDCNNEWPTVELLRRHHKYEHGDQPIKYDKEEDRAIETMIDATMVRCAALSNGDDAEEEVALPVDDSSIARTSPKSAADMFELEHRSMSSASTRQGRDSTQPLAPSPAATLFVPLTRGVPPPKIVYDDMLPTVNEEKPVRVDNPRDSDGVQVQPRLSDGDVNHMISVVVEATAIVEKRTGRPMSRSSAAHPKRSSVSKKKKVVRRTTPMAEPADDVAEGQQQPPRRKRARVAVPPPPPIVHTSLSTAALLLSASETDMGYSQGKKTVRMFVDCQLCAEGDAHRRMQLAPLPSIKSHVDRYHRQYSCNRCPSSPPFGGLHSIQQHLLNEHGVEYAKDGNVFRHADKLHSFKTLAFQCLSHIRPAELGISAGMVTVSKLCRGNCRKSARAIPMRSDVVWSHVLIKHFNTRLVVCPMDECKRRPIFDMRGDFDRHNLRKHGGKTRAHFHDVEATDVPKVLDNVEASFHGVKMETDGEGQTIYVVS